jgi:hypothetical protein
MTLQVGGIMLLGVAAAVASLRSGSRSLMAVSGFIWAANLIGAIRWWWIP